MKCLHCGESIEHYRSEFYLHTRDDVQWIYCSSDPKYSHISLSVVAEPADKSDNFKSLYEKLSK